MNDPDVARMQAVLVGPPDPEIVACEARIRAAQLAADVAALRARLTVEVGGALHRGTFRYTRVWAREGGGPWRVAGGHVGAVPDAWPDAGASEEGP